MTNQMSFGQLEFSSKRKKTQKEIFFERKEKYVPLEAWCDIVRPHYYVKGNGREAIALEVMLKMYLVSNWFNLSDPQTEDILNENMAVRNYVGIVILLEKDSRFARILGSWQGERARRSRRPTLSEHDTARGEKDRKDEFIFRWNDYTAGDAPDETTLCKFRKLLEENGLTERIFKHLTEVLIKNKVLLKEGAIVDASFIEAPNSIKNKDKQPNPHMKNVFVNLKVHQKGFKKYSTSPTP